MKKLKLLLYSSLLVINSSLSFGQNWNWGEENSGNGYLLHASPVATDKNGNAYITGSNENTTVFGAYSLTGVNYSSYLVKYNSSGTVIWANQIIDNTGGKSYGNAVATDKAGNIYISGNFWGNAQAGTFSLSDNDGTTDDYLIKYNANGTVLWAKQSISSPTNSYASPSSVATDKDGNVYLCGNSFGTVSFGSFTLTNGGIFLVKYDSNGVVLWAKQSESTSAESGGDGNSVTTDKNGNVYITGCFFDTLSFGSTSLIDSYGGYQFSGFIAKYSSTGNVLWAKQTANTTINGYCTANAIITDNENSIYITGSFYDSVEFGSTILYNISYPYSMFLAKYDTNGNTIWAKQSTTAWFGTGLACDAYNHVYMAGQCYVFYSNDTLTFNNYTLYANASTEYASYIMKIDTSGQVLCGSILNNVGGVSDSGTGVACDSSGTYIYVASGLNDSLICGPDTLVSTGVLQNCFLGRWQNCGVTAGTNELKTNNENLIVYPNPNNGVFTISIRNYELGIKNDVEVYNMLGEKVFTSTLPSPNGGGASFTYPMNLSAEPNGIYLYRVISETGDLIGDGKLIIQK